MYIDAGHDFLKGVIRRSDAERVNFTAGDKPGKQWFSQSSIEIRVEDGDLDQEAKLISLILHLAR
jgi:hypothetical protein